MKREYSIIFWLNQPPKVEVGAYNYVSSVIVGETYYICAHDLPEERKLLGWDKISYGKAKLVILSSDSQEKNKQIKFYIEGNNVIHIVCGLRGSIADIVCPILKKNGKQFYVVSERPSLAYNSIRSTIHSFGAVILHKIRYLQYRNNVRAFLALGKLGVSSFHQIGWPSNKLYRFMYCGEYSDEYPKKKVFSGDRAVRFLYIGRFKYKTHAVDILQEAFNNQNRNNWQLDMAGGYGDDKESVLKWINSVEHAHFIGKIDASKVQDVMAKYDIVMVPSRADGWNCQINEALYTNTPVITTVESVSSELVEKSQGGIVIKTVTVDEFTKAIAYVLDNPDIIQSWSDAIYQYRESYSPKSVGEYLLDIIEYTTDPSYGAQNPVCPW